jgi:hypothetical protein
VRTRVPLRRCLSRFSGFFSLAAARLTTCNLPNNTRAGRTGSPIANAA